MRSHRRRAFGLALLAAAVCVGAAACDPAPADVREWTPADHDQPSTPQQNAQVTARPGGEGPDPNLIELAWQRNCFSCHGGRGQGDGPQGPMVRAPDLTDQAWQGRVTDAQIAEAIRRGGSKMPPFDLPQPVIDGLVRRIRASAAGRAP
ncbi:MAG: cytochrome c [Myxococcales bacterium]|nr:cytochrome c [Myxococcales bacterium]